MIQFETKLAEITTPASKMRDGENRSDICFVMNIKYLIPLAKKIAKTVLFFYHQIQQLHHWKATRGGQIFQLDLIFPSSVQVTLTEKLCVHKYLILSFFSFAFIFTQQLSQANQ